MKYYISTPELNAQITEIQRKIRLSMNGIVSDQMTESGIIYKKNFGVSIPRLKEIAASYSPNHDLAQRLWSLKIRETMILATLLEPIDNFTSENAQRWAESFNQTEIIEQCCMNLFYKLSFANQLCDDWVCAENKWIQVTGFVLAARIFQKLNPSESAQIIYKAFEKSVTEDFHLYKAIALCLSRFCRKDKKTASIIKNGLNGFSESIFVGQQFISNEVKQEILFLEII
jgi:3-methyladenine DNA glycosylase AlkD